MTSLAGPVPEQRVEGRLVAKVLRRWLRCPLALHLDRLFGVTIDERAEQSPEGWMGAERSEDVEAQRHAREQVSEQSIRLHGPTRRPHRRGAFLRMQVGSGGEEVEIGLVKEGLLGQHAPNLLAVVADPGVEDAELDLSAPGLQLAVLGDPPPVCPNTQDRIVPSQASCSCGASPPDRRPSTRRRDQRWTRHRSITTPPGSSAVSTAATTSAAP
jgi:hypothetical protein